MNEGELRAIIVDDLSGVMNEKFKTFKVALEPMNISGVDLDDEPVEVEARNPREAIIKASTAKGLKKGDWMAVKTKSIKVIKEDVEVSEAKAKPAGLSKDETLKIAQMVADAITKADGKKTVVNMKTLEEDSFDLDYDGTEYEGGSYNLDDNGDIRNMATSGSYVGNWKKDTVKDLVKFYKSADFNESKK